MMERQKKIKSKNKYQTQTFRPKKLDKLNQVVKGRGKAYKLKTEVIYNSLVKLHQTVIMIT